MIRARAFAKINWALDILATHENGYHEMDMLMQSISLCDTLTFEEADEIIFTVSREADPDAERNLVVRAAKLLQKETGCTKGARIDLVKRTPAMAGLGGGSGDCAAAFRALNELWNLGLSGERLTELGFSLGADVAFCMDGGLQRVRGLGEQLEQLTACGTPEMLLVMPDGGLSTGAVFGGYDRMERTMPQIDMERAQDALLRGDYAALNECAANALTPPAMQASAAVGPAIDEMYRQGAVMARMSGSGSAVFGVFRDADEADRAQRALSGKYAFCERITTSPVGVELGEMA